MKTCQILGFDELERLLLGHSSPDWIELIVTHPMPCPACRERLVEVSDYRDAMRPALIAMDLESQAAHFFDNP